MWWLSVGVRAAAGARASGVRTVSSHASILPRAAVAACAAVPLRGLRTTAARAVDAKSSEKTSDNSAAEKRADEMTAAEKDSASRVALWNQMLNTIIVDNAEQNGGSAVRTQRSSGSSPFGTSMDPWSSPSASMGSRADRRALMDELENEFRHRPTAGLPEPATPTTGRSYSAFGSGMYGKASAPVLYRNLMSTLRRNNVRRELKLQERYEKPNEMRRRKRSERHRRRFADMIRKKVQLVMALKSRGL